MARHSSGPPLVLWLLFGLFWNGFLAVFDSILIVQLLQERDARARFVEVPAVVTNSEVEVDNSGDGTSYRPRIEYRYTYEGDEFTGDRYSFSIWSSGDGTHSYDVVERHPEGAEITIRVDPDAPAESVIDVSGDSFPRFMLLFLAPFHCAGLWLIGRAIRASRARGISLEDEARSRFIAIDRPGHLVVRRPRAAGWEVFLFALGLSTFFAIFPLAIFRGMDGASPLAAPVLSGCIVLAIALTAVKHVRDRRPSEYLHVDRRLGTFSYPADTAGHRIDSVRELRLDSHDRNVQINDVSQYDHRVVAITDGLEADVFAFRGGLEDGRRVREAIADEFGLTAS